MGEGPENDILLDTLQGLYDEDVPQGNCTTNLESASFSKRDGQAVSSSSLSSFFNTLSATGLTVRDLKSMQSDSNNSAFGEYHSRSFVDTERKDSKA